MMDKTREKLIEILRVPIYPHLDADPAEVVADYLLDNGVIIPVRCKNCRHYNPDGGYCGFWGECRHPEHYCEDGEREDNV